MSKTIPCRALKNLAVSFETIEYCAFDDQIIDDPDHAYFDSHYGLYFHSREEAGLFSEDLGHRPKLSRAERRAIEELGI